MKTKEKLFNISTITMLSILLVSGLATAATVTYFSSTTGTANVDAPLEFTGDFEESQNFDTTQQQTYSAVLENVADNDVGINDHITVTFEDAEGDVDVEDAIDTLKLEVDQETNGEVDVTFDLEGSDQELNEAETGTDYVVYNLGQYVTADAGTEYGKDLTVELKDNAQEGEYTIDLAPHVQP